MIAHVFLNIFASEFHMVPPIPTSVHSTKPRCVFHRLNHKNHKHILQKIWNHVVSSVPKIDGWPRQPWRERERARERESESESERERETERQRERESERERERERERGRDVATIDSICLSRPTTTINNDKSLSSNMKAHGEAHSVAVARPSPMSNPCAMCEPKWLRWSPKCLNMLKSNEINAVQIKAGLGWAMFSHTYQSFANDKF